ncbi:hypothetical protein HDU91_007206 [Kappamyces sp. JEL0680]|nr:hypothetical protein HDU91_007206 [Kappamyces sp. JEL0680]
MKHENSVASRRSRTLIASGTTEILDIGKALLSSYSFPILAITDGPAVSYLFERQKANDVKVTRFFLPSLKDALNDSDILDSPSSYSSSLPEATGEAFQVRIGSVGNLAALGSSSHDLLLNPLGAGDTCSAIFLLEYLDTRVSAGS